jgi:hypothetical protein
MLLDNQLMEERHGKNVSHIGICVGKFKNGIDVIRFDGSQYNTLTF